MSFDPSKLTKTTAADYSSSDSESEDDYRAPGLNPDGDDEFGDFNPRKRRRIGKNNKEKAALGIFASDSEDDGPGKKWKSKTLRNKGMSFVSTTQPARQASHDQDEEEEDSRPVLGNSNMSEDDKDEDEDGDQEMGLGLGFGKNAMAASLLGAKGSSLDEDSASRTPSRPKVRTKFDGSSVLGRGFVPSSAGQPELKVPSDGGGINNEPPRNKPQVSAFSSKGKINAKSFGARMMAKMGYVDGQGLGKEGQGRNVVVEANLRPQGVGLGAVKEKSEQERQEEKRQAKLRGEEVVDSDEEEKKRKRRSKKKTIASAFDSAGSTPRRQKPKYLTAEELKAAAPGLNIPEAFTPILDMTGPGGKMLTSASGIMTPTSGVAESTEIIEARKLVKRAQADLMAFSEEWRSLEERKKWTDLELTEKEKELEDLTSDFERIRVFSNLVSEQLVTATEWRQVITCLQQAIELGSVTTEVANLAVAAMNPFLRDQGWDPLAEPKKYASDMIGLRGLLMQSSDEAKALGSWNSASAKADGVYRRHHKATTPYESMMYKTWLPQVLASVRTWDPMDPTPLLNVMESWDDLLPPFVRAQLTDNIARKLEAAVSDWEPRKKRQSHHLPHTWLFPWLQYLPPYHVDPKGTGLVADVKRKFRRLIDVWEFERGVVPGLTQWQDILGDQWRPLMMSHVLPSMGRYLRINFHVDPADQEQTLHHLTGVLKWSKLLGKSVIAEVLVQSMFPMWNAKLEEWLALEEADLGEVAEWYGWWRGVLLKEFAASTAVCNELDKGLRVMNMAA
ncbi:hypothetical protein N3K66_008698 [Trichothecium roseum]|uniref:Uncharacterized protein n=1 Tax=Trichothecium roseum TaxID=47278 RepID=A0ACC0UR28_9HYPO|nr:hypothetical protein N3K66_008698 [Trichothecium roseum]